MKRTRFTGLATGLLLLASGTASAAPALRVQVTQRGDFVLIGNTIAQECDPTLAPAPVIGTVSNCGTVGLNDSAPDVYWRADVPAVGMGAQADINLNTSANARSGAQLNLPAGASVTHAYLYWAASLDAGQTPTNSLKLERPGGGGFGTMVTALNVITLSSGTFYQSVADITTVVQAQGAGYYRVGGFNAANLANVFNNNNFAGWWMAVFYKLPTDPPRNLALFDGFDSVNSVTNSVTATLSGFKVPNAGFTGKLGVITFEGDNGATGDSLTFNGSALSDALNPATNFFNGTRSFLGAPVSVVGDLPQLTGTAGSMSGIDLDVVDITSKLSAGQTSATINATTKGVTSDAYFLSGFITSITTFKQDFTTSTKSVSDVNGGAVLAGDTLQYTITVTNSGNDDSVNTVVTDPLPAGVTFVPGSIQVTPGLGQGAYDPVTNTVVARVGAGATSTQGGTVAAGQFVTVSFQVKINAGTTGTIANQATITAAGKQGAPSEDTPTDGNGPTTGAPPTSIVIDACADDTQCGTAQSGRVCDPPSGVCLDGCRGKGGNGCPQGEACTTTDVTIGSCLVACLVTSPTNDCMVSNECAYGFCDPVTQLCRVAHKIDGTPCLSGICIAGGCLTETTSSGGSTTSSSASSGGGGTSAGISSSGSTSQEAGGAGGADVIGDVHPVRLHGGACSASQDVSTPMPFSWLWLAVAVQRFRRRSKGSNRSDKTSLTSSSKAAALLRAQSAAPPRR